MISKEFEPFSFAPGIQKIEDLQMGMKLPGIVTNVTSFGAFVDLGVNQDGLLHIIKLQDGYVQNPTDIFKPRQRVTLTVTDVDLELKRISLTVKQQPAELSPLILENPVGKDLPYFCLYAIGLQSSISLINAGLNSWI
jgi:uncharacterized protein